MPAVLIWGARLALMGGAVVGLRSVEDIGESARKAAPWLAVAALAYVLAKGRK